LLEILRSLPAPREVLSRVGEASAAAASPSAGADAGQAGPPSSVTPGAPMVPTFLLRNGNRIRARMADAALPLETPYGPLQIPIKDLNYVHFALVVAPAARERIDQAIAALGDEEFKTRERASADLRAIGIDAIPALRSALTSPDEEIRVRAGRLLDDLDGLLASEDEAETSPLVQSLDRVSTLHFTIDASVSKESFALETPHGGLTIPRGEIARIQFRESSTTSVEVQVHAAAVLPDSWIQTRLDVDKGQKLLIEASGQMGIPDWGESCGPEGLMHRVHRSFSGMRMLALVAKVGKGGAPFAIGSRFEGKAPAKGTLFLGIVPFQYGNEASGAYTVRVKTR
jgi:hypothetical protein